ncbi:MAG: alpha/beta fold hydrolase [Acidimicrobiia bacterium]
MPEERTIVTDDAVELSVLDLPGESLPHLFFGHATGFCRDVWLPVVDELRSRGVPVPATTWDYRCHGRSAKTPHPLTWGGYARDVLAVRAGVSAGSAVGVGHSMGATTLVLAWLEDQEAFQGLVLVEPIIFAPPFRRGEEGSLIDATLRRKTSFADRGEARQNFATKPPFDSWDARALDGYLTGGLTARDGRVWLACRPEDEAETYREGTAHQAFGRLGEVVVPVLVVAGSETTSLAASRAQDLAERFPDARSVIVPGASHFLPMERPETVAGLVAEVLG